LRGLQFSNLEINDDLFGVRILGRQSQHIFRHRKKLGFFVLSMFHRPIHVIDGPGDFINRSSKTVT